VKLIYQQSYQGRVISAVGWGSIGTTGPCVAGIYLLGFSLALAWRYLACLLGSFKDTDQSIFCPQANDEARQQSREYEETKKQIEEDADREILDIKNKYERRLRDEKEANMRLKGETGIMKKKVSFYSNYCFNHII